MDRFFFILFVLSAIATITGAIIWIREKLLNREIKRNKKNRFLSILIISAMIISIVFWYYFKNIDNPQANPESKIFAPPMMTVIDSFSLDMSESKKAILDGNIFIGKYYNELIIGGVNIELVTIAVRNSYGERVLLDRDSIKGELSMEFYQEKYFELEYKNNFYLIEQLAYNNYTTNGKKWYFKTKSLENISMTLKPYNDY